MKCTSNHDPEDFTAKDAAKLTFYLCFASNANRKLVLRALVGERVWKRLARFSSHPR